MRNQEIADLLSEIADLYDLEGVRFKPEAYRRAARQIEGMTEDVEALAREGRLDGVPGVGSGIGGKIAEFAATGKIRVLEELRAKFPPGLQAVMRVRGVGPKTAQLLREKLGISSVEELRRAAQEERIRTLKGMGPAKEAAILHAIDFLEQATRRFQLPVALLLADIVALYLREHGPVERAVPAGSVRRGKETVGDLDILAISSDASAVTRAFVAMPNVREVLAQGEDKTSVVLHEGIQCDLRILPEEAFGAALQYFTGSKDHNIKLRGLAQDKGLKLNEYGLFRDDVRVAGRTEEEVYGALGLAYIEPELREDRGEVEAAAGGRLPNLVRVEDIRGDLHVHTNRTDGAHPLADMVRAAKARGYAYVGISDHSASLAFVRGLKADEVLEQRDRVRAMNHEVEGMRVLCGSEVDIHEDGSLDYEDEVLAELDYAIGAVHSKFNLPEREMTDRVCRAMENRHMDILAHPTTRLIGRRDPIALDMVAVVAKAAETRTILEVNAYPDRLDLNDVHARLAKEHGARLIIDTDSHATAHLDFLRFGILMARRGWLEPGDVVNTRPLDEFLAALK